MNVLRGVDAEDLFEFFLFACLSDLFINSLINKLIEPVIRVFELLLYQKIKLWLEEKLLQ